MEVQGVDVASAAAAQPAPPADVRPAESAAQANAPAARPAETDRTLSSTIGRLFGASAAPDEARNPVSVSYRSAGLDEIVTVFTDPATGKEIAEFPSQILMDMAAFFDKPSGITLDHNA